MRIDYQYGTLDEAKPQQPGVVGFYDSMAAAFKETSSAFEGAQYFAKKEVIQSIPPEEGYDPSADPQLDRYRSMMPKFEGSRSRRETAFRIGVLEKMMERQEKMALSPFGSFVGMLGGIATSPENYFIPAAVGRSILKGAGLGIAANLGGEAPFYLTREDYDPVMGAAILAAGGGIGGLTSAFTKRVNAPRAMPSPVREEWQAARGVGADIADEAPPVRTYQEELDDVTLVHAGGLEKMPFNPVMRGLNSASLRMREAVRDLVEDGGMIFNEYLEGVSSARSPVETNFRVNWMGGDDRAPGLLRLIRRQDELYADYLGVEKGVNTTQTAFNIFKRRLDDTVTRVPADQRKMSRRQFREEIGRAMKRGDEHAIPEVAAAAREWRKLSDRLRDEAMEMDMFTAEMRYRIMRIQDEAARQGRELDRFDAERIQALETQIEEIRANGPDLMGAKSYFTRILKLDKIDAETARFIDEVVKPHLARSGVPPQELDQAAENMVRDILHTPDHAHIGPDDLPPVGSARERRWDIDDELLDEWVENDVEQVMRYYTRTLGTDIELSRQFGGYDMRSVIEDVRAEYEDLIQQAPDQAEALGKQRDRDLRDLRALRDRLRGTYGQPSDPYRPLSRFYRITKGLASLAYMGGVTISSLPDMVRPAMTEGLTRAFRDGIEPFFNETTRLARRMAADEVRLAGEAGDIELAITATQLADIGDIAGRRFPVERAIGHLVDKLFMINGLNSWNTMMKEWTGVVVSARIIDTVGEWGAGTISQANRTKLLRSGIDEEMAQRIAVQLDRHSEVSGTVKLPNTAQWEDMEAVAAFRGAISRDVSRTIVTPGVGDKALWTSTEWGSVMTQFKTYGQAAMSRVLISGLQERDAAFFMGAAMLIGMGHLTNQLKQAQYGYDPQTSFTGDLVDAIDRSGVLGFFMDVNNSLERMSDYTLGVRPLIGEAPGSSTTVSKLGAAFGPGASLYANAGISLSHLAAGDGNALDAKKLRSTMIYNSVPWLDPIFDGVEEGVLRPLMERNGPRALFEEPSGGIENPWRR